MTTNVAVITQLGAWSASTRTRALRHVDRLQDTFDSVDVFTANDRPDRHPGRMGQALFFVNHGVRYCSRYAQLHSIVDAYDALLVQRGAYAMGPGVVVRPIERFRGRVVLDLDDALLAETPSMQGRGAAARWLYGPQQARRLLERADEIVVSTEVLAAGLPPTGARVTVLPTVPDVQSYRMAEDGGTAGLIGWVGTNGGLRYLDPLRSVLSRLSADRVGRLRVVSSEAWSGPSEFQAWSLDDETRLFAEFAVGIMPLPDTEYARAKAGYKLLQYMAAGIPVVASPVGVNTELVERSGAGFLAGSPDEWDEALRLLLASPSTRSAMGRSGRAFVEELADPAGQAAVLASLLRGDRG